MRRTFVFALAVAVDARLGDPPTALHPVGLVGLAAGRLKAHAPQQPRARLRFGALAAAAIPLGAAALTSVASRTAARRNRALGVAVESALLSLCTSLRTLERRAIEVQTALQRDDLPGARRLLGYHLVSRDTSALDASGVAAATIESVAENLSDAVVAPWVAYLCAGLPGAAAYRATNTLDALWGYRTPEFEQLGKGAARLDDALNYLPARLTAAAITLAAGTARYGRPGSRTQAHRTWRRDAARTASPNAGHPMAAMAGALSVRLEKEGAYVLGEQYPPPAATDIGRAVRVTRGAAVLLGSGVLGALIASSLARSLPR